MSLTRYLLTTIKIGALASAALAATVLLFFVLEVAASVPFDSISRNIVDRALGVDIVARRPPEEVRAVMEDHRDISTWVLECIGFLNTHGVPEFDVDSEVEPDAPNEIYQDIVNLPGIYSLRTRHSEKYGGNYRALSHPERNLIRLSRSLAQQRVALSAETRSAYNVWQVSSVITIGLGMITTILVSISSTEFGRGDGSRQRLIRLLAVVFPAVGTAASAVIAFYAPQAKWSQASRTIASLTQLHGQMAMDIWKLNCARSDADIRSFNLELEEWSKRYLDIQTISSATSGSTGGQSPGGAPGGSGAPGAGGARKGGS